MRKLSSFSFIFALSGALLLLLFASFKPAHAATFIVGTAPCLTTIQACIDQAAAGDTVQIPSGVYNESLTLTMPITLQGSTVTHPIIRPPTGQRGLLISGTAILSNTVIEHIQFDGADIYQGNNTCIADECGGGIAIQNGAFPTLRNLDVTNNRAYQGGGIYLEAGTSMILEDTAVTDNIAIFTGGGIYGSGNAVLPTTQQIVIRNSQITNNDATVSGGGISWGAQPANAYTFSMHNSTIADNTMTCTSSNCDGAGADLFDLVSVTIVDSLFQENVCTNNGSRQCSAGGLAVARAFKIPQVAMTNTSFISNTAGGEGGGMVMFGNAANSLLSISGGIWSGNTAVNDAGGAFVASANITISGTQFISNTARKSGGAIKVDLSVPTFQIANSIFERNRSVAISGGAIAVSTTAHLQLTNTTFLSNVAAVNGGAITFWEIGGAQGVTAVDSSFSRNRTIIGDGGAIWMRGDLNLTNTTFTNNAAEDEGGAIFTNLANTGIHRINGGLFQENSAQVSGGFFSRGGGALNISAGNIVINGTQFLTNTTPTNAGSAGAIYAVADITITNALFQGNQAINQGGAISINPFASDATLVTTDTTFLANEAGTVGGAIRAINARVNGGLVQSNTSGSSGGGISTSGTLLMTGTQVLSNTAGTSGGGISASDPITLTSILVQGNRANGGSGGGINFNGGFDDSLITGTQVLNNIAITHGGGINHGGNLFLINSNLAHNTAAGGDGGGLNTFASVFMTNTTVLSNTAAGDGGGMDVNSTLRVYSGRFQDNVSGDDGGGVYAGLVGIFRNADVTGNRAQGDGGGLYANFRAEGMTDNLFQNNIAQNQGGGLFVTIQWLTLSNTQFINNSADMGGGIAITGTSGTTGSTIVNTVFSRNSATTEGADLRYEHARPLDIIHSTFADHADSGQRSIVIYTATVEITNTIVSSYLVGIDNRSGIVTLTNNLYFNSTDPWLGLNISEFGGVFADPTFVDGATDDFRLVQGSPAIDAGVNAGIFSDILGTARPRDAGFDIGAYEGTFTPTAVTLTELTASAPGSPPWRWFLAIMLLITLPIVLPGGRAATRRLAAISGAWIDVALRKALTAFELVLALLDNENKPDA